jgi:hypothetical protein
MIDLDPETVAELPVDQLGLRILPDLIASEVWNEHAYCKACHPGAIERRWTRQLVLDAMLEWSARFGRLPSSYDWSRTHARRRGGEALARLGEGDWPSASVVAGIYGSWRAARMAAANQIVQADENRRLLERRS